MFPNITVDKKSVSVVSWKSDQKANVVSKKHDEGKGYITFQGQVSLSLSTTETARSSKEGNKRSNFNKSYHQLPPTEPWQLNFAKLESNYVWINLEISPTYEAIRRINQSSCSPEEGSKEGSKDKEIQSLAGKS